MINPIQYLAFLPLFVVVILIFMGFASWILFSIAMVLSAILVLWPYIELKYKRRRIEREEHLENLQEGGIEEPRPLRPLSKEEEATLRGLHKTSQWIAERIAPLIILFLFVDVTLLLAILWPALEVIGGVVVALFILALLSEALVILEAVRERARYLDLRSPVFRIQGQVIKEKIQGRTKPVFYITVRKVKFSEFNYPDLPQMFNRLKDGDEVIVEYSPRTKRVWRFYILYIGLKEGKDVAVEYNPRAKQVWKFHKPEDLK